MFQGITVGRIWGIEIKLNSSLLIIALLVTAIAGTSILPHTAPGFTAPVYLMAGGLIAILFIASVLWHELAHSLIAIRYKIPVVQIVLYVFGGVAQIARDPDRPIQEFWIALAGPISSLILAIGFGVIARLGGLAGASASYLSTVNASLVIFNLLPGFPLDGGRVLRSILWAIQHSYKRATRQASRVGQGVAILLALSGIGLILAGYGLFNGVWLLLIALFLYSTASALYRGSKSGPLPLETSVRRVMRFNVPVIAPNLPLAMLAWKYMDQAHDQAFPVLEGDYLVGMITAAEVDPIPRLEWGKVRAVDAMRKRADLRIVAPDDELSAALAAMDALRLDHAPVIEAGRLVGMLNRRDIVYRT